jgi:cellulose synthase/poly-beta-1,6-N-acetylglucosamine synthase-like glycosyltransferase
MPARRDLPGTDSSRTEIAWSAMQSAWQSIESMHSLWRDAILLIALAPLVYYIVATIAALRFLRRKPEGNSDSATSQKNFTPPVSVLKPVHGVDFGSVENFESFCLQSYPEYEILFAVNRTQHSPDFWRPIRRRQ